MKDEWMFLSSLSLLVLKKYLKKVMRHFCILAIYTWNNHACLVSKLEFIGVSLNLKDYCQFFIHIPIGSLYTATQLTFIITSII